jgi:hypothetical protein
MPISAPDIIEEEDLNELYDTVLKGFTRNPSVSAQLPDAINDARSPVEYSSSFRHSGCAYHCHIRLNVTSLFVCTSP